MSLTIRIPDAVMDVLLRLATVVPPSKDLTQLDYVILGLLVSGLRDIAREIPELPDEEPELAELIRAAIKACGGRDQSDPFPQQKPAQPA